MKIMHVGMFKIGTTNGTFNALWSLAKAQANLGNEVHIVRVGKNVSEEQYNEAKKHGVILHGYPSHRWMNFWKDTNNIFQKIFNNINPDIVHFQYVRIPKFFFLSRFLKSKKVPYVVSTHGGLNPVEMRRRRIRKLIYWYLIERYVHRNAKAIHFVTEREKADYYKHYKVFHKNDIVLYNPVEIPKDIKWKGYINRSKPKLVFLGRYDIWNKGLDLTCKTVRILNKKYNLKVEFHIFGSPGNKFKKDIKILKEKYKDIPFFDHGFIWGKEKFEKLSSYDFYIQHSRFELFGISLVEALGIGMPAFVSETSDLAADLKENNAAFIIPIDPEKAASTIANILNNKTDNEIIEVSSNARNWAYKNCNPINVAMKMIDWYRKILLEK